MRQSFRLSRRVLLMAIPGVLAVAAAGGAEHATAVATLTYSFPAAADSYVNEKKPKVNFGAKSTMQAGQAPIERAYVRFGVAGLEGTVTRATLRVYVTASSPVGFGVRGVSNTSWGERTITYANAPPVAAAVTASSGPLPTAGWVALDVTPLLAGNGPVAFALTSTATPAISLVTREGDASRRPSLLVETNVADTPPANTSPPTVSGTAEEGRVLSADAGTWSGTQPISYDYRWRRCDASGGFCSDITGAGGSAYTLGADDVGRTIRVAVTATNAAGAATAESAASAVVAGLDPPASSSAPTIAGTAVVGTALTADPGSWSGSAPIAFAYLWSRCDANGAGCIPLAGATSAAYTILAEDVGATLRVAVTATNVAGSATATSAPTAVVAAAPDGVVVAAAGDLCGSPTDCAPTASLLDAIAPQRVLALGDLAYESGTLSEFDAFYDPNWGRHKAKTSPAPGNHEYITPGAAGYFTYFGSLAPAAYYSFDLGSWHVISLNTEVSHSAGSAQETWLRNDLAANAGECVLAYAHRPRFSSGNEHGSHPSLDAVWRALYAAGADVVLAGHEHSYERFAPQSPSGVADPSGIRQFVVGTGGHELGYTFGTPLPTSEIRNSNTAGVLELTLRGDGYDWRFVPVAGATFTDSGSGTCEQTSDTTPPSAPTDLAATVSSSAVGLQWTASTDDTGVTGYDVFRDGAQIASTTAASFTDTTFAPGTTYVYVVRARDAAGNVSLPSDAVTVTTPGAPVVTLSPIADARVEFANPATNYGSSSTLRVQGGSDPAVESNVMFDVPALSGTVRLARLRLFASTGTVAGPSIHGSETGWVESAVIWNTRPGLTTGSLATTGAFASGTWVEWDVTAAVTSPGRYSFTLVSTSNDGADFRSRESSTLTNRPQLVLTME
jgi:chitodextrinase